MLQPDILETNLKEGIISILISMNTEEIREKTNPREVIDNYATRLAALLTLEIAAYIQSGEVTFAPGNVTGTVATPSGPGTINVAGATSGVIS